MTRWIPANHVALYTKALPPRPACALDSPPYLGGMDEGQRNFWLVVFFGLLYGLGGVL